MYLTEKSSVALPKFLDWEELERKETKGLTFLKEELCLPLDLCLWVSLIKAIIYLLPGHVAFHQGLNQYFSLYVKFHIFLG